MSGNEFSAHVSLLHLSLVPVEAPLEAAGVVPPAGVLLLLALYGVLLGLVLVHHPRLDAVLQDVKLHCKISFKMVLIIGLAGTLFNVQLKIYSI